MLKTLRKRPRTDNLVSQKRMATNRMGRRVYLGLLVVFAAAVINYLFGDFVILRADGLVLRERSVIAATTISRVEAVEVTEGQHVGQGEELLRVQSTELLERLAELSTRRAQLAAAAVDFAIRSEQVKQLLPLAQKRDEAALRVLSQFDRLASSGFARAASYDDALAASFSARQDRIKLATESEALQEEMAALDAAREDADRALADLQSHYAKGIVRAPAAGQVGASVPAPGDVYRPGEQMLAVYWGPPFVLAYLPRRYLFPIRKGMKVFVSDGRNRAPGWIDEILAVTDALPKEFQNAFKPQDRNQLAKIRFASPPSFPLHQKVEITRAF